MEFRLLGPVELWCAGQQYELGSIKARCVLAVLLLNLGIVVPVDVLIARVWDDDPPAKARESLSAYVTRLRRVVREVAGDRVTLESRAHGYLLRADPSLVDIYRYRLLRRDAAALAAETDHARAVVLLREADLLWHGEPLAGLPGDGMSRMRHSLAEERRAATRERIELELTLGRHADLVGEISLLLDLYQTDEALAALQMKALYLSGRQSDALAAYRRMRENLIRELGTEPGPALSGLHDSMLRGDPGLTMMPPPHAANAPSPPITLPPVPKDFVGREAEIEWLTAASDATPVMVVTGMPGIGKTTLAVAVAYAMPGAFSGGRLFVSFNAHDPRNPPLDAAGAVHRLLRMLEVPADRIPHALAQRAALWRAELSRRQLVIVLDDVPAPEQVRPLLPTAPGCKVVITSRNRLSGLSHAAPLVLDSLPTDDGVRLFTQVAGRQASESQDVVAEIVRRCGGHPLAIRLAARSLREGHPATPTALLDELSRPVGPADGGDGPGEQILTLFELACQGLTDSNRRMFRRLGLHPGTDITLYAAAALEGASLAQSEAALAALVDHNLLERSHDVFRFHDLIRRYAITSAVREETRLAVRQSFDRLVGYYRFGVQRANQLLYPDGRVRARPVSSPPSATPVMETPQQASSWLEAEWRNALCTARQAAKRERKEHCADLIHELAQWLETAGHWEEAVEAHGLALQACRDVDDVPGIARAFLDLSLVSHAIGRAADALHHAETATATYRQLNDQLGLADALNQVGTVHKSLARFREALAYHEEARDLYGSAAYLPGVASALNQSGIDYCHLGRYQAALDNIQAALTIYRQFGDRRGEAKTLNNLGRIYRQQGFHRDALRSYQDALEIFNEIGGEQSQAILKQNIGGVHYYKGNYEKAITSYQQALIIYRRIGDLPGEINILNDIGVTFQAMDEHARALESHQRAEEMARELGDTHERVIALRGIANAQRGQGHHGEALAHYRRALRLAREMSEPYQEGKVLDGIAETTLQTQGPDAARIYWHQAYDLFQQLGVAEAETIRLRLATLPPQHPASGS